MKELADTARDAAAEQLAKVPVYDIDTIDTVHPANSSASEQGSKSQYCPDEAKVRKNCTFKK